MNLLVKSIILTFLVTFTRCNKVDPKKYLFKYGYQDSFSEKVPILADTIKVFQTWAHIPVTGTLTAATISMMNEPRCGMRDPKIKIKTNGRVRRYLHQGTSWNPLFLKQKGKMELRWSLISGPSTDSPTSLRFDTILKVMRQAILYWHEKTNIDFVEVPKYHNYRAVKGSSNQPEILISFESGDHNDGYHFDGRGGTLAHAFYPHNNEKLSGDVHFDNAEQFTYQQASGRNLLWVATHELGHSLGLEHSQVRDAIMYPWYTKYKPGFKLQYDDIRGIQQLYGGRSKPMPVLPQSITTTTTTTTTQPPSYNKGKCPKSMRITAVYYSRKYSQKFAFTEDHKILFLGYRNRIPVVNRYSYFPKIRIPGAIDALYTSGTVKGDGKKYQIIFSGDKYHVYDGFTVKSRGFHSIHDGSEPLRLKFPSWVKKIDATFTWPGNGRTYFFSGKYYWRYANKNKRFDRNYPKPILGNWPGLPKQIDAAYSSPDKKTTFFLSGDKYYLFDDINIRVKAVYPMNRFLQCDGAAAITDNVSIGGLTIGSLSLKPKKTP